MKAERIMKAPHYNLEKGVIIITPLLLKKVRVTLNPQPLGIILFSGFGAEKFALYLNPLYGSA